jgi:hypothetical protein
MKKLLAMTTAVLVIAGLTTTAASARRHHHRYHGSSWMRAPGNNAELQGNNGNSGSGSNSLGHIKGGNTGSRECAPDDKL